MLTSPKGILTWLSHGWTRDGHLKEASYPPPFRRTPPTGWTESTTRVTQGTGFWVRHVRKRRKNITRQQNKFFFMGCSLQSQNWPIEIIHVLFIQLSSFLPECYRNLGRDVTVVKVQLHQGYILLPRKSKAWLLSRDRRLSCDHQEAVFLTGNYIAFQVSAKCLKMCTNSMKSHTPTHISLWSQIPLT